MIKSTHVHRLIKVILFLFTLSHPAFSFSTEETTKPFPTLIDLAACQITNEALLQVLPVELIPLTAFGQHTACLDYLIKKDPNMFSRFKNMPLMFEDKNKRPSFIDTLAQQEPEQLLAAWLNEYHNGRNITADIIYNCFGWPHDTK